MSNVGNEESMAKIQELMAQQKVMEKAQEVNLGGELRNGVLIEYVSSFGNTYKGWVEFKRPTAFEYMMMGAEKSEILRRAGVRDRSLVDNSIVFMAHVMATLSKVIVKAPEWLLDIEGVKETDVIYHVYAKFEEWEDSFRKKSDGADASGDSKPTE